jgi:hypothetical protein
MVGATTISPFEDTLNNKLFSLFFFFVLLSLSPLNLFVFATAKIETPAPSLRKLM